MSDALTVEVAVPLPLRQTFHYSVPAELADRAVAGQRVQVRFGPRKIVGYVVAAGTRPPPGVKLAPIVDLPDLDPIFDGEMLAFLRWLADYYHAPVGEVLRGAHPAGMNASDAPGLAITDAGLAEQLAHPALERLPARSIESSCVFHGPVGCTLPRNLRADICNYWQCSGRWELRERLGEAGESRAIAVALAGDHLEHPQAGSPVARVVSVTPGAVVEHDDLEVAALSEQVDP